MNYAHRLEGDRSINLEDFNPADDAGLKREHAEKKTAEIIEELIELQELLYAARRQSLLIVLQGRDTSGKDGVIRHVAGPLNSQSCSVSSFKVPTEEELAHDFLWRIHAHTPRLGDIKIFNRSHYEDVLVARVHKLAPKEVWRERYSHINEFERSLTDSSTIILKFYLHISKEEQEERLLEREKDATKSWKLSVGDWKEREYWDDYTKLTRTRSTNAFQATPWFIVPADKKGSQPCGRGSSDALVPFRKEWLEQLEEVGREKKKEIEEYRIETRRSGIRQR
jgi:PPK2 family polyphosphate:nucleotide phosphotransferase